MTPRYICVDFDGTVVTHKFPAIGEPVPNAIPVLKRLQEAGHKIILWTMRSGVYLDDAVQYLTDRGVELYGVNENPDQHTWTTSPKAYGHHYIDDAAMGCPLVHAKTPGERPFVAWGEIENYFNRAGFFDEGITK